MPALRLRLRRFRLIILRSAIGARSTGLTWASPPSFRIRTDLEIVTTCSPPPRVPYYSFRFVSATTWCALGDNPHHPRHGDTPQQSNEATRRRHLLACGIIVQRGWKSYDPVTKLIHFDLVAAKCFGSIIAATEWLVNTRSILEDNLLLVRVPEIKKSTCFEHLVV